MRTSRSRSCCDSEGGVIGQDGLLQGGDAGYSQGLQGASGKMVFSRVVMLGIVRDYRGLLQDVLLQGGDGGVREGFKHKTKKLLTPASQAERWIKKNKKFKFYLCLYYLYNPQIWREL